MIGEFIGEKIEFYTPKSDEIIVWKFNIDMGLENAAKKFQNISEGFPNNSVIAIPSDSSLEIFEKDNLIIFLKNIINNLENRIL